MKMYEVMQEFRGNVNVYCICDTIQECLDAIASAPGRGDGWNEGWEYWYRPTE